MAITATLVFAAHNRLRYLLTTTSTGTDTGTITTTGGATPDVRTDLGTNQGPVLKLARAATDGFGIIAAGALTQGQARSLWLSDRAAGGAMPMISPNMTPTAVCKLVPQNGSTANWFVDANVSGGNPTINLTSIGVGVSGGCYLDIEVPNQIGE